MEYLKITDTDITEAQQKMLIYSSKSNIGDIAARVVAIVLEKYRSTYFDLNKQSAIEFKEYIDKNSYTNKEVEDSYKAFAELLNNKYGFSFDTPFNKFKNEFKDSVDNDILTKKEYCLKLFPATAEIKWYEDNIGNSIWYKVSNMFVYLNRDLNKFGNGRTPNNDIRLEFLKSAASNFSFIYDKFVVSHKKYSAKRELKNETVLFEVMAVEGIMNKIMYNTAAPCYRSAELNMYKFETKKSGKSLSLRIVLNPDFINSYAKTAIEQKALLKIPDPDHYGWRSPPTVDLTNTNVPLSKRQEKVEEYIKRCVKENGFSRTFNKASTSNFIKFKNKIEKLDTDIDELIKDSDYDTNPQKRQAMIIRFWNIIESYFENTGNLKLITSFNQIPMSSTASNGSLIADKLMLDNVNNALMAQLSVSVGINGKRKESIDYSPILFNPNISRGSNASFILTMLYIANISGTTLSGLNFSSIGPQDNSL